MFAFPPVRTQSRSLAVGHRRLLGRNVHHRRGGGLLRLADCGIPQRSDVLPPLQAGGLLGRIQRCSLPGAEEAFQTQRDHDRSPEHRAQQNEQLYRQPDGENGQREEFQRRHHTRHETRAESQEDLRVSMKSAS